MNPSSPARNSDHYSVVVDLRRFDQDGYAPIARTLDRGIIKVLRNRVDGCFEENRSTDYVERVCDALVLRYCWELDPLFRDLFEQALVTQTAEAILGKDYRVTGMSCIRTSPGTSISLWHVDDVVEYPLPAGHPGHPQDQALPILLLGIQIPLTDIDDVRFGPTQYVPGSHRSGRGPGDDLRFRDRTPVDILCRAGEGYVQNFQCWHRGAPNTSERTRYLFQIILSPGWIVRRCSYARERHLSSSVMAGASDVVCKAFGFSKPPPGSTTR